MEGKSNSVSNDRPFVTTTEDTKASKDESANDANVFKKSMKRNTTKTVFKTKNSGKAHVKSRKYKKVDDKIEAKENTLEEEDSLHATMDLGGTTIPAEPLKSEILK